MQVDGGYGSGGFAAAALDHARLSYHYLDTGDTDGFASLFEADAVLRSPGMPPARGRDELERRVAGSRRSEHTLHRVFASGNQIATIGRFSGQTPSRDVDVEFADIFTVSENGLLVSKATYFFTSP
jgi:ketosteroid isomerase-like protein